MMLSSSQLLLEFASPLSARESKVPLRVFRSEQEYFQSDRDRPEEFNVELPRPFQESALMDTPRGWRQRPRPKGPALDLGYRMWLNLPESIRDEILSGNAEVPKRVAILSASSGIDDVPWEWLNAGSEKLITLMDSVRFLRLVPTLYAAPPLTITPPLRVLLILTNPKDERFLQANIEIDIVSQPLRRLKEYEVNILYEPKWRALREALEWSPHIIHYVGHSGVSGTRGNLILHDEREGTRWVPASEISPYIPASVRLLCLSTCVTAENYQAAGLSKFAHSPAEICLPTTIVNQYALHRKPAALFWERFYSAVLEHDGNIVQAFHDGQSRAHREDHETLCSASFSLVVRDGVGHPLRLGRVVQEPERFAAEIQAEWSARLANNLATRKRLLSSEAQKHWEHTLSEEAGRLETFERRIKRQRGGSRDDF